MAIWSFLIIPYLQPMPIDHILVLFFLSHFKGRIEHAIIFISFKKKKKDVDGCLITSDAT